ncbi:MAG TPA: hypothetical protein DD723_02720 [Candidatus Omnitrophica bacterium]|nr:MAG: hypothetical protein A2Z81_01560 [Omnitrophica WOR_2 bacterium GWA2_45_18]HBR14440.1 hypothetical protein [Candidatus Omnitrophota bacterium]
MIQVELSKIIIDEKRQDQQIIVLKEKNGTRQFPIVIGIWEASSIKMKIADIVPPRPMTHDLLAATISGLHAKLERMSIDKMVNNTFYAKLELKTKDGETCLIDARPSDAIAVAVRLDADIFVAEDILNKVAIFKSE